MSEKYPGLNYYPSGLREQKRVVLVHNSGASVLTPRSADRPSPPQPIIAKVRCAYVDCKTPGATGKRFNCGKCKRVYYCGNNDRACQRADWPRHKHWCLVLPIERLPTVLVSKVLNFMRSRDLCACSRTSTTMHRIANLPGSLYGIGLKVTTPYAPHAPSITFPAFERFRGITALSLESKSTMMPMVEQTEEILAQRWACLNGCKTSLRRLHLIAIDGYCVGDITRRLPAVTQLVLIGGDMRGPAGTAITFDIFKAMPPMPSLLSLEVSADAYKYAWRETKHPAWSMFPALTHLRLEGGAGNGVYDRDFLARLTSLPQLTTLHLSRRPAVMGWTLPRLPNLTHLDLSGPVVEHDDSSTIPEFSLDDLPKLTNINASHCALRESWGQVLLRVASRAARPGSTFVTQIPGRDLTITYHEGFGPDHGTRMSWPDIKWIEFKGSTCTHQRAYGNTTYSHTPDEIKAERNWNRVPFGAATTRFAPSFPSGESFVFDDTSNAVMERDFQDYE